MADPLQTVSPGQPFRPSAALHNATVDLIRRSAMNRANLAGTVGRSAHSTTILPIHNGSGAAIAEGGVLAIDGPMFEDDDDPEQTPRIAGIKPTSTSAGKIAVLLEPVEDGDVGFAVVSGVTWAKLLISTDEENIDRCDVYTPDPDDAEDEGTCEYLVPREDGSALILWPAKEDRTSSETPIDAMVLLNAPNGIVPRMFQLDATLEKETEGEVTADHRSALAWPCTWDETEEKYVKSTDESEKFTVTDYRDCAWGISGDRGWAVKRSIGTGESATEEWEIVQCGRTYYRGTAKDDIQNDPGTVELSAINDGVSAEVEAKAWAESLEMAIQTDMRVLVTFEPGVDGGTWLIIDSQKKDFTHFPCKIASSVKMTGETSRWTYTCTVQVAASSTELQDGNMWGVTSFSAMNLDEYGTSDENRQAIPNGTYVLLHRYWYLTEDEEPVLISHTWFEKQWHPEFTEQVVLDTSNGAAIEYDDENKRLNVHTKTIKVRAIEPEEPDPDTTVGLSDLEGGGNVYPFVLTADLVEGGTATANATIDGETTAITVTDNVNGWRGLTGWYGNCYKNEAGAYPILNLRPWPLVIQATAAEAVDSDDATFSADNPDALSPPGSTVIDETLTIINTCDFEIDDNAVIICVWNQTEDAFVVIQAPCPA